jgi:exopolysaccharide biosynthesis polyprenyl glycosylphosphotransferase
MKNALPKIFAKRYFPYIDLVSIFVAFCLTYAAMPFLKASFSPYPDLPIPSIRTFSWILILFLPIWFTLIRIEKGYRNLIEWSYLTIIGKMVKITVLTFAFATLFLFILQEMGISRLFMGTLCIFSLAATTLTRVTFRIFQERARKRGDFREKLILIGDGKDLATFAASTLAKETSRTFEIAGYVSFYYLSSGTPFSPLGNLSNLREVINNNPVNQVIWISSKESHESFPEILQACEETGTPLRIIDGFLLENKAGSTYLWRTDSFGGLPSIYFTEVNWSAEKDIIKRMIDLAISSIALLLLSPLMGLIALVIKLSSPGPVIFKRTLVGQQGKSFVALKYRSMENNAHELLQNNHELWAEYKESLKIKRDTRVTKVGRILRMFSLDELPQLINVFRGEMSIVGPRMLGDIEWDKYGEAKAKVLSVKPGITGLWQVSGGHGVSFEERIRYDMQYIQNWNIWMDLRIILKTIPALWKKRNQS